MLDTTNQLRVSWDQYATQKVRRLVSSIPLERRGRVLEEIRSRLILQNPQSERALTEALKLLGREA